jgi:hypothetical protein
MMTAPETALACQEFENHLTDYLDGFLPAAVFHRWERHAVLCEKCTDLPGEVVRSIAACYTYKTEELPVPEGLHAKILQATIGTERAADVRASWISQTVESVRCIKRVLNSPDKLISKAQILSWERKKLSRNRIKNRLTEPISITKRVVINELCISRA